VVSLGTYTAYTGSDPGKLLDGMPLTELFEPSQLRNLEVDVLYVKISILP